VPAPRVALVTGEGVSAYEAGEVWHLLDRRVGMPVTMIDSQRLGTVNLARYTAVVLVSGTYTGVSAPGVERLKGYVERGGTLIAIGTSIPWLGARKVVAVNLRQREKAKEKPAPRPYAFAENDMAAQLISGAIFRTIPDHTHPLCYGLEKGEPLPVFRNNRVMLEPTANAYSSPVVVPATKARPWLGELILPRADKPLLSGYISEENIQLLAGSASVAVVAAGRGRAILMAEDPNFRGFWDGTNRLFYNAVFFGPLTRVPVPRPR
jgi:hypothetical protein